MSNLDEVEEKMRLMVLALEAFQDELAAAAAELRRCHDRVDLAWQDEARRQYDQRFGQLQELLAHYVNVQGPRYIELLSDRHKSLVAYLYGDR